MAGSGIHQSIARSAGRPAIPGISLLMGATCSPSPCQPILIHQPSQPRRLHVAGDRRIDALRFDLRRLHTAENPPYWHITALNPRVRRWMKIFHIDISTLPFPEPTNCWTHRESGKDETSKQCCSNNIGHRLRRWPSIRATLLSPKHDNSRF